MDVKKLSADKSIKTNSNFKCIFGPIESEKTVTRFYIDFLSVVSFCSINVRKLHKCVVELDPIL